MSAAKFDVIDDSRWLLAGILFVALGLRVYVALSSTYHWDEEREWIPLALSISLSPGQVNLPIHSITHPILPAYLIKMGSLIGGENAFGFRLLSLLAALATVGVVAHSAARWRGYGAALWTAALLAFNEYHIFVSTLAIDKPFQLLFVTLAVASFMRFLETENPRALYLAGVMTGLGFLCKETTVLLLPGFLAVLLFSARHRPWLLRAAPYVAATMFFLVISPDIFINVYLKDELQYSYTDHLQRAAGIGFTRHHLLFFVRGAVRWVYGVMGEELSDLAPEYASMNSLLGIILLGTATWMLVRLAWNRVARQDYMNAYLAFAFWIVLGFFMSIRVSAEGPIRELVYVAWFWSDLTLVPGVLMAGAVLASLPTPWRIPARGIAAVALGLAIFAAVVARVGTPRGPIVAFNPEFAWPSDGRLVDVDARFNYCMICATDMVIELVDVQLRHPDGSITPALGTDSVMVRNADGTELLLRARIGDPAENPDERWQEWMWYAISYALTDGEGRRQVVEDRVVFPLQSAQYGPRFWTGEIEGTERR